MLENRLIRLYKPRFLATEVDQFVLNKFKDFETLKTLKKK
jgi:hypothetical protein